MSDGLLRARPGEVGVDSESVEALLDEALALGLDLQSFLVYRHERLVVEDYRWPYRADRPRITHSVTKSFTACAVGMAVAEGWLSLEDRVIRFFPEHLPEVVSERLAAMMVRDLLTMRTGHAEETSGSRWRGIRTSWVAEFFKIPLAYAPGEKYVYTSAASYMLSAIVSRVTKQTVHEYLKPRLFEPLGITGETWDVGPDGVNSGGNGLTCKVVDLLKLGVLHLNKGMWEEQRVLPEVWVEEATRAFGDSNYGYHWVTGPDGSFFAMGLFGQLIAVFPAYDAVITLTSAINDPMACSGILVPLLQRHLERLFQAELPYAREADRRLAERVARSAEAEELVSLAVPRLTHRGVLSYSVEANSMGVRALRLYLSRAACTLRLIFRDAALGGEDQHAVTSGVERWLEGDTDIPGARLHHGYEVTPAKVVAGGRWLDEDTLEMNWIFAEMTFRDTVVCRFAGDRVTVTRRVNVNSGAMEEPVLVGVLAAV